MIELVDMRAAHEKIRVVDAEWIRPPVVPSPSSSVTADCLKVSGSPNCLKWVSTKLVGPVNSDSSSL